MKQEEKSLLIALSLGDGYIDKQGCIHIEHSQNQKEYLEWKYNLLERLCPSKRQSNISTRERLDKRTNKIYKQISCHKQHRYFKIIRKWLYKPEKTYTKYILNKLTPQGIAIWYMDDGGLKKNISKVTGKISSIQLSLYTYCSLSEAKLIQDFFIEKYGVEFKIYKHSEKYLLCANTLNGNKFLDLVRPFIIKSMKYKDLNSTNA